MRTTKILYKDIPIRNLEKYTDVFYEYCEGKYTVSIGGAEYPGEPPYVFVDFYPEEDRVIFELKGELENIAKICGEIYRW